MTGIVDEVIHPFFQSRLLNYRMWDSRQGERGCSNCVEALIGRAICAHIHSLAQCDGFYLRIRDERCYYHSVALNKQLLKSVSGSFLVCMAEAKISGFIGIGFVGFQPLQLTKQQSGMYLPIFCVYGSANEANANIAEKLKRRFPNGITGKPPVHIAKIKPFHGFYPYTNWMERHTYRDDGLVSRAVIRPSYWVRELLALLRSTRLSDWVFRIEETRSSEL
jgi:hypothetical protein